MSPRHAEHHVNTKSEGHSELPVPRLRWCTLKVLPRAFFERPVLQVAKELVGTSLVRRFPDGATASVMVTEVEAYDGPEDLASHASKGRTPRTEVMFGPAGVFYVYLIYGIAGCSTW